MIIITDGIQRNEVWCVIVLRYIFKTTKGPPEHSSVRPRLMDIFPVDASNHVVELRSMSRDLPGSRFRDSAATTSMLSCNFSVYK